MKKLLITCFLAKLISTKIKITEVRKTPVGKLGLDFGRKTTVTNTVQVRAIPTSTDLIVNILFDGLNSAVTVATLW